MLIEVKRSSLSLPIERAHLRLCVAESLERALFFFLFLDSLKNKIFPLDSSFFFSLPTYSATRVTSLFSLPPRETMTSSSHQHIFCTANFFEENFFSCLSFFLSSSLRCCSYHRCFHSTSHLSKKRFFFLLHILSFQSLLCYIDIFFYFNFF